MAEGFIGIGNTSPSLQSLDARRVQTHCGPQPKDQQRVTAVEAIASVDFGKNPMDWTQETSDLISKLATTTWPVIASFLESNFITALFGAGFGAFGAHFIAKRTERRKQVAQELREANAANILVFAIFQSCTTLKEQYVLSLKKTFHEARKQAMELIETKKQERFPRLDFATLTSPTVPIEPVRQIVFEKLSTTPRPIILVAILAQSLDALSASIQQRNTIIEEFKSGKVPKELIVSTYFGLPMPGGIVDARYGHCVDAIAAYTDDCIFFAHLLSQDLERHAKQVASRRGKQVPTVHRIDVTIAKDKGLIPDEKLYQSWVDIEEAPASPTAKLWIRDFFSILPRKPS